MKIVGITGGIGSGKSVVSKLLETMEIPVYNSDTEAKKLTESSLFVRGKLSEKFGNQLYSNGKLNKTFLADLIFNSSEHLAFVNSVIHPEVYKDFLTWKQKYVAFPMLGIESAILFESGFDQFVNFKIVVSAPLELRIERLRKRENLDEIAILNRIKNQMSEEEKINQADYVIINDDIQPIIPQVENILKEFIN
jgi:dephospho-CoA kinase